MNGVDALLFLLLALADIALIVHLRRRRNRQMRQARMYRSLAMAIRRETQSPLAAPARKPERYALTFRRSQKPGVEVARMAAL